jgi:hypothetical protein
LPEVNRGQLTKKAIGVGHWPGKWKFPRLEELEGRLEESSDKWEETGQLGTVFIDEIKN